MNTGLKITEISATELMNHESGDYNRSIWKNRIKSVMEYKNVKFYFIAPNEVYRYYRFFASYVIPEGIHIFKRFDPFCSSLTSNGFTKIQIDNQGNVYRFLFKDSTGNEGCIGNTKQNRLYIAKRLAPLGVMVSNDI